MPMDIGRLCGIRGMPKQLVSDPRTGSSWRCQIWGLPCECPTDCPAQPSSAPPEKKADPALRARNYVVRGEFPSRRETEANRQDLNNCDLCRGIKARFEPVPIWEQGPCCVPACPELCSGGLAAAVAPGHSWDHGEALVLKQ